MKSVKKNGILTIALALALLSLPALAQNKKLMTVNAAKTLAERAIVESIVGLKVKSATRVEDMIAQSHRVDAKTSAAVAGLEGIEFTDIIYDPEKDVARVTASIHVGRVKNVLDQNIDYGDITVERVAFATSTESQAGPLKAMRAAEIDAYEKLAKKLVGFKIDSKTSVEDFVLKSDVVKSKLLAAIYGAKLESYSWDKEGNAHVRLSLKADYVRDVIGQKFLSDQPEVEAEGIGSQVDDFSGTTRGADGVKEGKIAVPTPSSTESTGGAAAKAP
ncbi:MAG: hypothetical protein HZB26_10805 [Candidatus Hydrogenedentes bacterium]|nr:hypothetical protein [Candidatus Hydrogenedentota bacterium]